MFSSLASFLKIKKKAKKDGEISRKNSRVSIGKDVLELLDNRSAKSDDVRSEFKSRSPDQDFNSFISERLLQGSSDSKPEKPDQGSGSTSDNNKPRLYPDLNSVSKGTESDKEFLAADEEIKSIHEVVGEIRCAVLPKISNAVKDRKNSNILREETSCKVMTLQNIVINPTKYDYDFEKEYEVVDNSPFVISKSKYYGTIKDFEDLKIYRMNIDRKLKIKIINDIESKKNSTKNPIFRNYSTSFKSYRGDKRDVVNCP